MGDSFGAWLRRCRGQLGMSQGALAEVLAVDKQTISAWEREHQAPRRAKRQWVEKKLNGLLGTVPAAADGVTEQPAGYGTTVAPAHPLEIKAADPLRVIADGGFFVLVSPEEMRLLSLHRQGRLRLKPDAVDDRD